MSDRTKAAPLRHARFGWTIYNPKGGPDGMKSYDEYLLFCGHYIFTPARGKVIWKHRCKECLGTISNRAKA